VNKIILKNNETKNKNKQIVENEIRKGLVKVINLKHCYFCLYPANKGMFTLIM